jgi:hypothetical protein
MSLPFFGTEEKSEQETSVKAGGTHIFHAVFFFCLAYSSM